MQSVDSFLLFKILAAITGVYGLILLLLAVFRFRKNNRLQTAARYANRTEILNFYRTAKQQLRNPAPDAYCLYIGSFDRAILRGIRGKLSELKVFLTKTVPSLFVPFANFSIEILGRAGIGKTFLLNLILASAIAQS